MLIQEQIQKYILQKIKSGEWQAQTRILSESQLSMMFECSRLSVRNALLPLVYSGLLYSQKGRGYIVAENADFLESSSFKARWKTTRTTLQKLDQCPLEMANRLKINPEDKLLVFFKKYYIKQELVAVQYTVLNGNLASPNNLESYRKSFTDELIRQGCPIRKMDIKLVIDKSNFFKKYHSCAGWGDEPLIEEITAYSKNNWIERTLRLIKKNHFQARFTKYSF